MSSPPTPVPLTTCRACRNKDIPYITYTPPRATGESLNPIKILIGVPPPGCEYKAVSHVWGDIQPILMKCHSCSVVSTVKLKSRDTFDALMQLVGGGSTIWIDNLSINQADHADVATQVAAMGKIYDDAKVVSVMLPPEDLYSFKCLSKMMELATLILSHRSVFKNDAQRGPRDDGVFPLLSNSVQLFFALIQDLDRVSKFGLYQCRAWTFQEWALARDVDVAVETPTKRATLRNVKSTIIDVAILAVQYKLQYASYAGVDVGFSRDNAAEVLETVKRLFPSEARFLADDEKDAAEAIFQTRFPSFGSDQLLGIRTRPKAPRSSDEEFISRLTTMLTAYRGGLSRHSSLEADKVCCWASMCNIDYDYAKDDTIETAVAKVTRALRKRGVKLYNFHALGATPPDVDPTFFAYSYPHVQSNIITGDAIPGIPLLTGRMDTRTHLVKSVTSPQEWSVSKTVESVGIHVDVLRDCKYATTSLDNLDGSLRLFGWSTSGISGFLYHDTKDVIKSTLQQLPTDALISHQVVVVWIPVEEGSDTRFSAWTIVSAPILSMIRKDDQWDIFAGREDIDGSLILAARKSDPSTEEATIILGYLAVTDNQCGSFIVHSSPEGRVRIIFETIGRSGSGSTSIIGKRVLEAHLELQLSGRPIMPEEDSDVIEQVGNRGIVECLESPEMTRAKMRKEVAEKFKEMPAREH